MSAQEPGSRARENLVHVLFNHNDFVTIRVGVNPLPEKARRSFSQRVDTGCLETFVPPWTKGGLQGGLWFPAPQRSSKEFL